jgi:hypothetical protein
MQRLLQIQASPAASLETLLLGDAACSDPALFGGEALLDAGQVAQILNISRRQLRRLIESGDGPPYYRFGLARQIRPLIRFRPSTVKAWAASQLEIACINDTS